MNALIVVLLALFFLLLCVLALVAARFFTARGPDGKRSAPGCLGGCAMAAVLTALGVAGLGMLLVGWTRARAHGRAIEPPPKIRIDLDDLWGDRAHELDPGRRDDSHAPDERVEAPRRESMRVTVRWPGHSEPRPALLEALQEAGMAGEIGVELAWETAAFDEPRSVATLTGEIAPEPLEAFSARVRSLLEERRDDLQPGLELVGAAREDLR